MTISIIDALSQQKKKPDSNNRVTCENGCLSISDAVFGVALYKAGYADIDDYIADIPTDKREQFLKQIGYYEQYN